MTNCDDAKGKINNGHNATSLIERLELQTAIDHATNCMCDICGPAITTFYGVRPSGQTIHETA